MSEERISDHYGSEPVTNSTDKLAEVFGLAREELEATIIQILPRILSRPTVVPILMPLIRQAVKEDGLAQQEQLRISTQEANNAGSSVPKKFKLQFRNKISQPVFTGKRILGENETAIEIALVDAHTDKIVNTGSESTAEVEIVGLRVGDNDKDNDDNIWTFEDFLCLILKEKKGKRVLQGNTCVQLKEGVCPIGRISFTHNSVNTKNGWYRLGAGVMDAALMNRVEVARTEAFYMKDGRVTYSAKHDHPSLADKVCHLQQIGYKGRYKHLKHAGVNTVKDFLICIYKDPKRLKDILKLGASSKTWDDIVNHAQMSNGMFLWLDPSNERKTGIVLNVKLQLKGLIADAHEYIPVDQLSDIQKADSQELVKFASTHLEMLHPFEDEASLKEYLLGLATAFNQSLGTSKMTDGPSRLVSNMGQSMYQVPLVISESEKGKEKAPFDNEMIYSKNYSEEHISFHAHDPTEPGSSCQPVECLADTCEFPNTVFGMSLEVWEEMNYFLSSDSNFHPESLNEWYSEPVNSNSTQNVCVCTKPPTRWIKVLKLLRRNSVRKRIGLPEGIQALKKQRCC